MSAGRTIAVAAGIAAIAVAGISVSAAVLTSGGRERPEVTTYGRVIPVTPVGAGSPRIRRAVVSYARRHGLPRAFDAVCDGRHCTALSPSGACALYWVTRRESRLGVVRDFVNRCGTWMQTSLGA